ncbi:hypothetical protein ACNS7O_18220 (plasmid) [Haloferacaceae archaeon DSL9]
MTEQRSSRDQRFEYQLSEYESLLERFREAGYEFSTFDEPSTDEIIIRHDVDLSLEQALSMAELEARMGVVSTYCFLVTTPVYDLKTVESIRILDRIRDLGHDIALHFDTHHYWDEDPGTATLTAHVRAECDVLGRLIDGAVDTASFHIPPEWVLDVDFDSFTNTYAPRYFSEIGYVSDSSQKWTKEPPFPEEMPETFQLLVHPGLWYPTGRSMADIVDEHRELAYNRIETYLDPLGK